MYEVLISMIIIMGGTLLGSISLIKKGYYVKSLKIFIFLYIIGQIVGYGFKVDILKAVIPSISETESGIRFQIVTSTILPLITAFIIKDITSASDELSYMFYIRIILLILIFIGLFQIIKVPKIFYYILLTLVILSVVIGVFKKQNKQL